MSLVTILSGIHWLQHTAHGQIESSVSSQKSSLWFRTTQSLMDNLWWRSLSNALLKSSSKTSVWPPSPPRFKTSAQSWVACSNWVSHDNFYQKSCCWSIMMLHVCSSRCLAVWDMFHDLWANACEALYRTVVFWCRLWALLVDTCDHSLLPVWW